MDIRIATTPEEMAQVYRLRYQCYVEELGWKYEHANERGKELRDPLDAAGTIYYAEDGGRMVATCCVHFAGGFELPEKWRRHYALDRFSEYPESAFSFSSRLIVVPDMRGSTVVPRMLMKAYEEGWRRGARFNFCYCRPRLVDLYERLGFIRYKDNILEPAQGYMVPMIMLQEDAEHLKAVRSPFHKLCLANRPSSEAAAWFDHVFPGLRTSSTKQILAPDDFWAQWAEAMSAEHVTLLRGLGQEHLKALLQAGTVLRCRAGDTLLREGEAGHEMFLILDGVARFSQSKENGRESQIGIAGKGEIFGEIALMAKAKRNATVEALSDMQVLVISQDFLNRAMKSLPDIAMRLLYNLSHVLAQKLQVTTQRWQETLRETERLALLAVDRGKGATLSGEAFSKASAGTPDLARTSILRRK